MPKQSPNQKVKKRLPWWKSAKLGLGFVQDNAKRSRHQEQPANKNCWLWTVKIIRESTSPKIFHDGFLFLSTFTNEDYIQIAWRIIINTATGMLVSATFIVL